MSEANPPKAVWSLNQDAFDGLMKLFDADRDRAGIKYELLRDKLVRFFEWKSCETPESLADETLDRVARKASEGAEIYNLEGYVYSVARMILHEAKRKGNKEDIAHIEYTSKVYSPPKSQSQTLACLQKCLGSLPREERELIISYYEEEKKEKIESRKKMATDLGISLTALRVRACRLRTQLESCLKKCLKNTFVR